MTKTSITPEERAELEGLLARASAERAALDDTLGEIEGMIGQDLDLLDEYVGNGIDVDALLDCLDEEDEA